MENGKHICKKVLVKQENSVIIIQKGLFFKEER